MKRVRLIISIPAICGLALVPLVWVNSSLFRSKTLSVDTLLALEIPLVLCGLISSFVLSFFACHWLLDKRWKLSLAALFSILIFFIAFTISGAMSPAFLYAT